VVSRFVVLCSFAMMPGRVLVVFGRLMMMFCRLLGHCSSSRIFVLGWRSVCCARLG
jgi:hypothetical protein